MKNLGSTQYLFTDRERKNIETLILDLESYHNDPLSYAKLLKNAIIHIEPEGLKIFQRSQIEEYRMLQLNKRAYSDLQVLQEIRLSSSLLMLTCNETLFQAAFRGMQAKYTKLYNIILQKKNGSWSIYFMQILNN
ncbi:hypothetical protein SOM12_04525 [Flavobacterium sp. CFBP9031]|uniref:hypothetical protein n=1 Tax=Flavobacterium sp. CFBP9031 TaxID=3096538 RepID=UPI002A6A513E|nr:hypothetical protein [Flavobacterium sp. CFBP9031]MDY0986669.1 hypothetical protein [Flavobacterium sp. CFBP9031]